MIVVKCYSDVRQLLFSAVEMLQEKLE